MIQAPRRLSIATNKIRATYQMYGNQSVRQPAATIPACCAFSSLCHCFCCCCPCWTATITGCGCLIVCKHCDTSSRENLTADAKQGESIDVQCMSEKFTEENAVILICTTRHKVIRKRFWGNNRGKKPWFGGKILMYRLKICTESQRYESK
jgi:hypothetical protein